MIEKFKMTQGDMGALLGVIDSHEDELNRAAGIALRIEMKMRLIGQFDERVRIELKKVVEKKGKKNDSDNYWDCELQWLCHAIAEVFDNKDDLDNGRQIRNKLLHIDFIDLMKKLKEGPLFGRQIFSDGGRNKLEKFDIKEAILSLEHNKVLAKFEKRAKVVIDILDKILWGLSIK